MFGRGRGHVRKSSAETLDPNVRVQSKEGAGTAGFMSRRQKRGVKRRSAERWGPTVRREDKVFCVGISCTLGLFVSFPRRMIHWLAANSFKQSHTKEGVGTTLSFINYKLTPNWQSEEIDQDLFVYLIISLPPPGIQIIPQMDQTDRYKWLENRQHGASHSFPVGPPVVWRLTTTLFCLCLDSILKTPTSPQSVSSCSCQSCLPAIGHQPKAANCRFYQFIYQLFWFHDLKERWDPVIFTLIKK